MTAIEIIKEKLNKYPHVKYKIKGSHIEILPMDETGFAVSLEENNGEYIVFFEGWHEHFTNQQEAINCVAFGLSDSCRLKVIRRSGKPYKWIVEHFNNGTWKKDSETGLLIFSFWKKRTKKIYQNKIIKSS
jgi:hypothetical protein